MNITIIKEITAAEYPLLEDFLFHAIYLPPGAEPPPREIIFEQEIYIYIDGFAGTSWAGRRNDANESPV